MIYRVAKTEDIVKVLQLHAKYQVDTIKEEDKKDGFVTTAFSKEELTILIEKEQGLFICEKDDAVLAYVMSASWNFWSKWPMFTHMIKDLHNLTYLNQTLSTENSYQYGPICIDKSVRGTVVLKELFDFDEPVILNASELGKGKHKVGAEVFVSWNKHPYIEKNEERMHSKEIEIDIN